MKVKKNKFFFNRKTNHNSYITRLGAEKSMSLDLTHSPSKNHKNEYLKLTINPNPLDDGVAYLSFIEREFENILMCVKEKIGDYLNMMKKDCIKK